MIWKAWTSDGQIGEQGFDELFLYFGPKRNLKILDGWCSWELVEVSNENFELAGDTTERRQKGN